MSATRTAERVALLLLTTLVLWDTWQLRRTSRTLDELTDKVALTEAKLKMAGDLRLPKMPMSALSPDLLKPRGGGGGGGGGGGARGGGANADGGGDGVVGAGADGAAGPRARAKKHGDMPNVPGAQVLSRLYDAADLMAADENWSNETYEQVALVFEGTTEEMKGLLTDLKAGKVTPAQAKEKALALRDDATGQLAGVLGKDGLQRLKGYIQEDGPQ